MSVRVEANLGWPILGSALVHAAAFGALILVPHAEAPKVSFVPVTFEVRPAKERPVPHPRPTSEAAPPEPAVRVPAPRKPHPRPRPAPRAASPRPAAPRPPPAPEVPAEVPAAVETVPLAGLDAPAALHGLPVPHGDPHGSPHGHPHGVRGGDLVPPLETPPPPPRKARPPPATLEPARPPPRGPVPLAELSRRPVPVAIEKAEYPLAARRAGLEGAVILVLTIDAQGRVTEALVRRGIGLGCDEAARDALLRSRFEPGLDRSGRPVATRIRYRYNFVLE